MIDQISARFAEGSSIKTHIEMMQDKLAEQETTLSHW